MELIRRFDWARECDLQDELEKHSEDSCPAGIGLLVGTTHILHICPDRDLRCLVHYHFPKESKLFGFIRMTTDDLRTWFDVPIDKVERMIDSYFSGDYASIELDGVTE